MAGTVAPIPVPHSLRLKINGNWLELSEEFVTAHPGGHVITQYNGADATHIFHAFHESSTNAYKQLALMEKTRKSPLPSKVETDGPKVNGVDIKQANGCLSPTIDEERFEIIPKQRVSTATSTDIRQKSDDEAEKKETTSQQQQEPVELYDFSIEREMEMVRSFDRLRQRIHNEGLMLPRPWFYVRKISEVAGMMVLVFWLQYQGWYLTSALVLALCWQQLGWLAHEFCHHQPSKNRRSNDLLCLVIGNFAQGFSRDWWKDKHNTHHSATNIIGKDDDIDLAPLIAMVPDDLKKYTGSLEKFVLNLVIKYQHVYFTALFPLLRFSWTGQSLVHAFIRCPDTGYTRDRIHCFEERLGLALHWTWVLAQLWFLPNNATRIMFFLVSQSGGGALISGVVSYNHNSTPKFATDSRLLNNFAALHILTTRNMRPSPFVDWLWGGLNYQIEHHLFPTMPRPNLNRCSQLVKEFCAENGLAYMVDDYWTGHWESLRLLYKVSKLIQSSVMMTTGKSA